MEKVDFEPHRVLSEARFHGDSMDLPIARDILELLMREACRVVQATSPVEIDVSEFVSDARQVVNGF